MYSFRRSTVKASTNDGGDDESVGNNSIAFSVDPEMITKLNIPVRVDQRSALDYDKMYKHQLERDLVKIVDSKGPFKARNQNFLRARATDPEFVQLSSNRPLGSGGETKDVALKAANISWQATSQPFGPIAQRHHEERVKANRVTISEQELKRIAQEKADKDLWDAIQYGHFEAKRRKKKMTKEDLEQEKKNKLKEDMEAYQREQLLRDPWKYRIDRSQFKELRMKISKFDILNNMKGWNKGHHPDHDFEDGFPKVAYVEEVNARTGILQDSVKQAALYGANDLLKSKPDFLVPINGSVGAKFREKLVEQSFIAADKLISKTKNDRERIAHEQKRERLAVERGNVRRGHQMAEDIKMDALHAFVALHTNNEDKSDEDINSSDEDKKMDEKLSVYKATRRKNVLSLPDNGSLDGTGQNDSVVKSVRFNDEPSVGHLSNSVDDSSMSTVQTPLLRQSISGQVPQESLLVTTVMVPIANIIEDIREVGIRRYTSRVKRATSRSIVRASKQLKDKVTKHFSRVYTPLKRVYQYFRPPRVNPYIVKEEPQAEDPLIAFEKSLAELQKMVDDMSEAERQAEKFGFKTINDDAANKRKRKLANLRKRLEEKQEAAEELRRRKKEHDEKVVRDKLIQEAAEAVEKAKERFALVAQLSEAIRTAHRGVQTAASKIGGSVSIEKKDQVNFRFLKEKMSQDKLKASEKMLVLIMRMREKQRDRDMNFRDRLDFVLGPSDYHRLHPPSVNELVLAVQSGDLNQVIDLIDTSDGPIHPNDKNLDGMSGMYAMLNMLLNMERAQPKHSILSEPDTPFDKVVHQMKKLIFGDNHEVVNVSLVLQLLLYKGGDVDIIKTDPDGDGWGIIHHAADQGADEFIEWLLTVNANVNLKTTKKSLTPLMCAARKDQLDSAMVLLRGGAIQTIDAVDAEGWTCVHHAAAFASPSFVQLLLLCGGKSNVRNKSGFSPVDEAETRRNNTTVELLRTFGEKVPEHMERFRFIETMYLGENGAENFDLLFRREEEDEGGNEEEEEEEEG